MTLKNMRVMEHWDAALEPFIQHLHVPVDSAIMKAAANGGFGKCSDTGNKPYSKPWSRWDYPEYIDFQEKERNAVDCSSDWEFGAWVKKDFGKERSNNEKDSCNPIGFRTGVSDPADDDPRGGLLQYLRLCL